MVKVGGVDWGWSVGRRGLGAGIVLVCTGLVMASRVAQSADAANPAVAVDARLLVVSAVGHDAALRAMTTELDTIGIPYTIVAAADLSGASLADTATHGLYNGVILCDCSGANLPGPDASAPLPSYLASFGVRSVCLKVAADTGLGFGAAETLDTSASSLALTFTSEGMAVFGWYAAAAPISVTGVTATVAPAADPALTPLLTDGNGRTGLAVRRFADGREVMLSTFDQAPGAAHSRQLLPGIASWVSRGVFVGEKRAFFGPQVDDIFLGTVLYDHSTFRMSGDDLRNAATWQAQAQAGAAGGTLALTLPFNGAEVRDDDPLTQAAREVGQHFQWVSHTFDHHRLDVADYARMTDELTQNDAVMMKYAFGPYDRDSLVTPDVSGLANPQVLQAAADWGIQQLVCDASYAGCNPPVPNTALSSPIVSSVLLIPRVPTDLYANVSVPDDWTSMYNALNGATLGRALGYDELVDRESDQLLAHLLAGDMTPWMFHQANLHIYGGGRTLLTDLLDKVLEKYRALRVLPLVTWPMSEVAAHMRARTNLASAGFVATIGPGPTITLHSMQAIRVAVTGARADDAESYGSVVISTVDVPAGGDVSIPLANAGSGGSAAAKQVGLQPTGAGPAGCGCRLDSELPAGLPSAAGIGLAAIAIAWTRRRRRREIPRRRRCASKLP